MYVIFDTFTIYLCLSKNNSYGTLLTTVTENTNDKHLFILVKYFKEAVLSSHIKFITSVFV